MDGKAAAAAIRNFVQTDLARGAQSRIDFFLRGTGTGGWEPWLQVEAVMALRAAQGTNKLAFIFTREVAYPNLALKCDLQFKPDPAPPPGFTSGRGTPVWIEFKTQRGAAYKDTIKDLKTDILKFNLHQAAITDVLIAAAIFVADANTASALNDLLTTRKSNTSLQFFKLSAGKWTDITAAPAPAVNDAVFVMWMNIASF